MTDENFWGLLPAKDGWREWFAWYPVKACGRYRWLERVQRRGYDGRAPWRYVAGRAHDYPDGEVNTPRHFYTYTCKHCGAKFGI